MEGLVFIIERKDAFQVNIVPNWHIHQWPPLRARCRNLTTARRRE
jgi:hypothetical protein